MAQKRMFDKGLIETDAFMDMSMPTKALYFLLGMEADDEGFVSPSRVIRIYGGNIDDLKVLIAKKFIIQFESGVIVITDWHKNNWLDNRRIRETVYQTEKQLIKLSNDKYEKITGCLADAKPMLREYRIEENRIEDIYASEFISFWEKYPTIKKKAKKVAFASWKKLNPNPELIEKIMLALEKHKQTLDWKKDKGQFIPYPATWLNQRRWEDEIEIKSKIERIYHE